MSQTFEIYYLIQNDGAGMTITSRRAEGAAPFWFLVTLQVIARLHNLVKPPANLMSKKFKIRAEDIRLYRM